MFLVLDLGDNDFGEILRQTLECIRDNRYPVEISKAQVINIMVGYSLVRASVWCSIKYAENMHAYFDKHLTVTVQKHKPTEDCNWGSAAMDIATGYIWLL